MKEERLLKAMTEIDAQFIQAHDPALAEKSATPRKHGSLRIALIAAAMAVCLLATTAFAVKVMGLDWRLLELLGAGEQAETLIAGAQVVDKTVWDAGSSLTVREVLGDRNNIYILLNFTAPKGTTLDADAYRFRGEHLTLDAGDGWYFSGYTKLEDTDSGDSSLDLVLKVTTDDISTGGTVTLEMKDLEAAASYGEPYVSLGLPGTWKVSFPLEYTDCSRTRTGLWEPVTLYGQVVEVTEISVSPLSVMVKGGGKNLQEVMDANRAAGEDGFFPVTLRFRDGTYLTTSREAGDNGNTVMNGGKDFYTNWTFHKVIDPEMVESIEFFGVSIPVR